MRRKTTSVERRLAREQRSAAIRAVATRMRQHGATYAQIGAALGGLSVEAARRLVLIEEHRAGRPRWHSDLGVRALNGLSNIGVNVNGPEVEAAKATAKFTRRQLLGRPNFGAGSVATVCAWLATHGLTLREPTSAAATPLK
jgi:hypothetical protein